MLVFVLEDDKRGIEISRRFLKEGFYVSDNINDIKYAKLIYLGLKGIDHQNRVTHQDRICYIEDNVFENLNDKAIVFTIVENEVLRRLSLKYDFQYISLLDDESFININSIMSAEGLISYMIEKIKKPIFQSHIMILGYGHCGKCIAERLKDFQPTITIVARNKDLKEEIEGLGYQFQLLSNVSYDADIVINTIPHPIIDKELLKKMKKDIMLFDIASFPYGIDHHEAIKLGLDSYIVPSIPSKYYCEYSSLYIVNFMKEKGDVNCLN